MFRLTLSFDNGPTPGVTSEVLDLLAARGLKATFFVVGQRLAAPGARALAERAREEGHWIGNHSWSHSTPLGRLDGEAAREEIVRTQAELGDLAHADRLFRPFGGGGEIGPHLLNRAAADLLETGGYTLVLWNSIPRDWIDPDGWLETAKAQVLARPWSAVVLHDLPTGAMAQLPAFLDWAAEAGAAFHQDFPPECTPLVRGRRVADLEPYVTGP